MCSQWNAKKWTLTEDSFVNKLISVYQKKRRKIKTRCGYDESTACNCYSCKSLSHQSLYADNC